VPGFESLDQTIKSQQTNHPNLTKPHQEFCMDSRNLIRMLTLVLAVCFCHLWGAEPGAAQYTTDTVSRYDFNYYYNSGSTDYFAGYLYAPSASFNDGSNYDTNFQPYSGGGPGYYWIYDETPGFDSSYDNQLYVNYYIDHAQGYDNWVNVHEVDYYGDEFAGTIKVDNLDDPWSGLAFQGTAVDSFSPFEEADIIEGFRFVVLGDSQTDYNEMAWEYLFGIGDSVNTSTLDWIVQDILFNLDPLPEFVFFAGDLGNWAFDDNGYEPWDIWEDVTQPLREMGIETYVAVGNHDLYPIDVMGHYFIDSGFDEDYASKMSPRLWIQDAFVDRFVPAEYSIGMPYYEFTYGNSQVYILDNFYLDPDYMLYPEGAPPEWYAENNYGFIDDDQIDWMGLSYDPLVTNRFAFAHHPAILLENDQTPFYYDTDLIQELDDDFDILFTGHEHLYSRLTIDDEAFTTAYADAGPPPEPVYDLHGTCTQIITGGAGAPLDQVEDIDPKWDGVAEAIVYEHHYIVVDVAGDNIMMEVKSLGVDIIETPEFQTPSRLVTRPEKAQYRPYYFTFDYNSGDHYSGWVITHTGYYSPGVINFGDTQMIAVEEGDWGYYRIDDVWLDDFDNLTDWSAEDVGKVYVSSYYDHETGLLYEVAHDQPLGTDYLASEWGWITTDPALKVQETYFGGGIGSAERMEADLVTADYFFTLTYESGNFYSGNVYAGMEHGYSIGFTETITDKNGLLGTYLITGMTGYIPYDANRNGQVYVASYHDVATGLVYTPLEYTQGLPSGEDYLGSEEYRGGIAQVTNNTGSFDVVPQILDDGRILWQGWDGYDYEIYCLVPGQGLTRFTDNDSPDVMPQMNASGDLVWMNWDNGDWEICYDFGEGPVPLTNNTGAFDVLPQITNDGLVYWQGWDGSDYELYCYNRDTGMTTQLTDNSLPDAAPQVNPSGHLTWMQYDGDWEVCYDIGSGPVQLTNNTGQDLVPQITPEGQVYWQGWDGSDYEVYRYTIGSGLTENLTNNSVDDTYPAVNNGILVWSQWDGYDWEIYRLIFDTGLTTRLTDDEHDDQQPTVNNIGQIVWHKWDGNDFEVYAYK
jgi:hypothetical protein